MLYHSHAALIFVYLMFTCVISQQKLSMGHIIISLRTLTISCDYLRCRVITIHLHWFNSAIKQMYSLRFVSIG